MPRALVVLAASIILLAPSSGALTDEPTLLAQSNRTVEKVFSDLERRVIREVLAAASVTDVEAEKRKGGKKAKESKGAPSGLTQRDRLPSGLERQFQRTGRLPPGLEKKAFPAHLTSRLPAPLRGTERLIIGTDAVLIDKATKVILDIIRDVVVNR